MSVARDDTQGGWLVLLLTLSALLGPAWLLFYLGGQGSDLEGQALLARAGAARERVIQTAIAQERGTTTQLRAELAEVKESVESANAAVLKRLRRELAGRRESVKPGVVFLLDESLSFTDMLDRMCRLALGEDLAGADFELEKQASRGFSLYLRFPEDPGEPEALAKLAKGLSVLPSHLTWPWVTAVILERPGTKPLGVSLRTALSAEAWQVVLETFRQRHDRITGPSHRLNYKLYKSGAIGVSHSLKVETVLELWGPRRISAILRPGNSLYENAPIGTYVLRGTAKGKQPWLGVFSVRDKHIAEVELTGY